MKALIWKTSLKKKWRHDFKESELNHLNFWTVSTQRYYILHSSVVRIQSITVGLKHKYLMRLIKMGFPRDSLCYSKSVQFFEVWWFWWSWMEWDHPASVLLWNILAFKGVSLWSTVIVITYVLLGNGTDCIFSVCPQNSFVHQCEGIWI